MTPLKKCSSCGDEWITNQTEVECLLTRELTMLVVIDENPIDEDGVYIPNPCRSGKHSLNETYYEYRSKKSNRVDRGCKLCRKERNLRAVLKYQASEKTSLR